MFDTLDKIVSTSINRKEIIQKLGWRVHTYSYKKLQEELTRQGLSTTHFAPNLGGRQRSKTKLKQLLKKGKEVNSHRLKLRLIEEKYLNEECASCKIFEWNGHKLSLHLDHIDGDRLNNQINNLRLLCPNCHSLTPTYCGRNKKRSDKKENKCNDCGKSISLQATRCYACAANAKTYKTKIIWPSKLRLKKLIETYPMVTVGKMLGVTDNAIRKRARRLGIL